jgi:hypothetical protein
LRSGEEPQAPTPVSTLTPDVSTLRTVGYCWLVLLVVLRGVPNTHSRALLFVVLVVLRGVPDTDSRAVLTCGAGCPPWYTKYGQQGPVDLCWLSSVAYRSETLFWSYKRSKPRDFMLRRLLYNKFCNTKDVLMATVHLTCGRSSYWIGQRAPCHRTLFARLYRWSSYCTYFACILCGVMQ